MSKKKIGLYLGMKPYGGGMFQYSQSILEALSALNEFYEIKIAYDKRNKNWRPILMRFNLIGYELKNVLFWGFIIEVFTILRIPVNITRYFGKKFNPLIKEILSLECDLWIFPAQDCLTYQLPSNVIGTIHDLMHRYEKDFSEVNGFFKYKVREHRLKSIANFSRGLLVDSKIGKAHVINSYDIAEDQIHILSYIAPGYLKTSLERSDFDLYYQLPNKFIFYPAQFWEHKNHIRIIEATKLALLTYPDIHVIFSGSKKYIFKKIENAINHLGLEKNIRIIGHIPDSDISGFYCRARALLMPTFFGPTNIPPLEARALGWPVLISDIYGMREQCGNAAIYFNPYSVNEITKSIIRIWNNDHLKNKMINKGYEISTKNNQKQFNEALKNAINLSIKDNN